MIDSREVIRAIMAEMAPKDHRNKSADELVAIGYSRNAAEAIEQAHKDKGADHGKA
jgi:hypothetical protein